MGRIAKEAPEPDGPLVTDLTRVSFKREFYEANIEGLGRIRLRNLNADELHNDILTNQDNAAYAMIAACVVDENGNTTHVQDPQTYEALGANLSAVQVNEIVGVISEHCLGQEGFEDIAKN